MKKYAKVLSQHNEIVHLKVKGADQQELESKLYSKYHVKEIFSFSDTSPGLAPEVKTQLGIGGGKPAYARKHHRRTMS